MDDYIERAVLARSILEYKAFKEVLSEEGRAQIEELDVFEPGIRCPITCCELDVGSKAMRLPCAHVFDSEAILQWLENEKAECPVCRQELPSKKVPVTVCWDNEEERALALERDTLLRNLERTAWLDLTRAFFPPTRTAHREADPHPFGMRDMNEPAEDADILREIMSSNLINPFDPQQI